MLITSFLRPKIKTEKKETAKKEFGLMIAKMCAVDIEPFGIVSKEGFINSFLFDLDYGAKNGAVDIKSILPDESTIRLNYLENI